MPAELHTPYEEAIRDAARTVGRLLIDAADIPHAWNYFRLIGEPGPIHDALENIVLDEDEEFFPLVEIARASRRPPRKGFDLVLDRQGICNAITLFSGMEAALAPDVRAYCVRRLVESLHDQLRERLIAEVRQHDNAEPPADATVSQLIAGRDWLFGDDSYLVERLASGGGGAVGRVFAARRRGLGKGDRIVRLRRQAVAEDALPGEPPFEDLYADHAIYLRILAGENVEAGLEHFRTKAESADPEQTGTRPAEVYVNLLLLVGRPAEAAVAARKLLVNVDDRGLGCPGPLELTRRQGDYTAFAEVARKRGDAVHFLAGLLAGAPTLEQRFDEAERNLKANKGVNWRTVRDDV